MVSLDFTSVGTAACRSTEETVVQGLIEVCDRFRFLEGDRRLGRGSHTCFSSIRRAVSSSTTTVTVGCVSSCLRECCNGGMVVLLSRCSAPLRRTCIRKC